LARAIEAVSDPDSRKNGERLNMAYIAET